MSRKSSKPSLKNYLSTGKVIIEKDASKADVNEENADDKVINAEMLLELFSPEDSNTWEPVFKSGAEIKREQVDLAKLRDFFRTMDRARFTLYMLQDEKTTMRIIRTGVQIREPFLLLLLWDDTGVASIYIPDSNSIL